MHVASRVSREGTPSTTPVPPAQPPASRSRVRAPGRGASLGTKDYRPDQVTTANQARAAVIPRWEHRAPQTNEQWSCRSSPPDPSPQPGLQSDPDPAAALRRRQNRLEQWTLQPPNGEPLDPPGLQNVSKICVVGRRRRMECDRSANEFSGLFRTSPLEGSYSQQVQAVRVIRFGSQHLAVDMFCLRQPPGPMMTESLTQKFVVSHGREPGASSRPFILFRATRADTLEQSICQWDSIGSLHQFAAAIECLRRISPAEALSALARASPTNRQRRMFLIEVSSGSSWFDRRAPTTRERVPQSEAALMNGMLSEWLRVGRVP